MNRVVLCGRLAERPRLSTSPTGLAVAVLRLQVPRQGLEGLPPAMDVIDCLAFDALARELYLRATPGVQINLEGWLLSPVPDSEGDLSPLACRVAVEAAYWLDPRTAAPEPACPAPAPAAGEATAAKGKNPGVARTKSNGFVRVHALWAYVATRFSGRRQRPGLNGSAGLSGLSF